MKQEKGVKQEKKKLARDFAPSQHGPQLRANIIWPWRALLPHHGCQLHPLEITAEGWDGHGGEEATPQKKNVDTPDEAQAEAVPMMIQKKTHIGKQGASPAQGRGEDTRDEMVRRPRTKEGRKEGWRLTSPGGSKR